MDYRQEIIDHYKHPRNFGDLPGSDHSGKGINAACGDMVEFYLVVENSTIKEIKWRGIGCAISTAAASLLSESAKGKKIGEIANWDQVAMEQLIGEINPGRLKCMMLPLSALKSAIK